MAAIRPLARQTKFSFSSCAALSRARYAVATGAADAVPLVRAAAGEVERNAATAPWDCLRAFADLERAATGCGAADVVGRAAELRRSYGLRHHEALAAGSPQAAAK